MIASGRTPTSWRGASRRCRVSRCTTSRKDPTILLTTANAILQRVPPRTFMRNALKPIAPGQRLDMNLLIAAADALGGFTRTGTVMEAGEFAVRGGILDVFPPGRLKPVRLDFFGDTLESIKSFDPETQRSDKLVQKLVLMPISEVAFGEEAEKRFRAGYVAQFGAVTGDDPLYQAVSAGQRYPGVEHWLPLFHDGMETLFDYAAGCTLSLDHQTDKAVSGALRADRRTTIRRGSTASRAPSSAPRPTSLCRPTRCSSTSASGSKLTAARVVRQITPFELPEAQRSR